MNKRVLTGIKDVDLKIISSLNDYELGKVCSVNKYVNELCANENFWRNRTVDFFITKEKVYENLSQLNEFRGEKTWKKYYSYLQKFVSSFIRGDVNAHETRPQDLREIILKFIANGDKMILLIDANKYEELDDFLNTHYLVSPAYSAIYIASNKEQTAYLFNRSRFDKRFDPYIPKIALQIFTDYGDNFKILLNYVNPNWLLEIIFSTAGSHRRYIDRIQEVLSHPLVTKETLQKFVEDPKVPVKVLPFIKFRLIDLQANKLI